MSSKMFFLSVRFTFFLFLVVIVCTCSPHRDRIRAYDGNDGQKEGNPLVFQPLRADVPRYGGRSMSTSSAGSSKRHQTATRSFKSSLYPYDFGSTTPRHIQRSDSALPSNTIIYSKNHNIVQERAHSLKTEDEGKQIPKASRGEDYVEFVSADDVGRRSGRVIPSSEENVLDMTLDVENAGGIYNSPFQKSSDTRDQFLCEACLCSFTRHDFLRANCTSRHLKHFPEHLPKKTIRVDISENKIRSVKQSSILALKYLQTLTMTFNMINRIDIDATQSSKLQILDLGYNSIDVIQDSTFAFVPNLRKLFLQRNFLTVITNGTFSKLSNLKVLDLSHNKLSRIEIGAFDAMTDLSELYLNQNPHLGYSVKRFPPPIFDPLVKLKILFLQGSANGDVTYPMKSLAKIKSLQHLNIDILSNPVFLGPEMLLLKRLKTLQFGPYAFCHKFKMIPTDFFQYVPYVRNLAFDRCLFHNFNPGVFAYLPELRNFSLNHMDTYSLEKAFQDLRGLKNSSLQFLQLSYMGQGGVELPCVSLTGVHAKYLTNLPLLELDLSKNQISLIRDDFIQGLPKTLRKWIISENLLTTKRLLWDRLGPLVNLVELNVNSQNVFHYKIPREPPFVQNVSNSSDVHVNYNGLYSSMSISDNDVLKYQHKMSNDGLEQEFQVMTMFDHKTDDRLGDHRIIDDYKNGVDETNKDGGAVLQTDSSFKSTVPDMSATSRLPKSLKIVKAAQYSFFGSYLILSRRDDTYVESLYLSNSLLTKWGHGHIPWSVKYADLSENYCQHLSRHFFTPNNSLTHINLSSNILGVALSTVYGGHFFLYLNQLKFMDISLNFIYKLPHTFLKGLTNLETLRITDNRLQELHVRFSETLNLRMLDLRRNSISWISKQSRDDLDQIASRHAISVALLHNPISCTCEGIDMIKWFATTKVHLLDEPILQCRNEYGDINFMGDIALLHKRLVHRCTDNTSIILSVSLIMSLFLIIVVSYYIGKRYRWWFYVKYKKNVWFAKHFGFKPKTKERPSKEYRYDAYLCCSEDDRRLAKEIADRLDSAHPLFIPFRDILPGMDEVSGMTSGILNSYKFILVFTENFKDLLRTDFKDAGMVEYTINSALFEERSSRREFFHVMKFATTEGVQIPLYLARVLNDQDKLTTFPQDRDHYATPEVLDCVWDSLSTCIAQKEKGTSLLSSSSSALLLNSSSSSSSP